MSSPRRMGSAGSWSGRSYCLSDHRLHRLPHERQGADMVFLIELHRRSWIVFEVVLTEVPADAYCDKARAVALSKKSGRFVEGDTHQEDSEVSDVVGDGQDFIDLTDHAVN